MSLSVRVSYSCHLLIKFHLVCMCGSQWRRCRTWIPLNGSKPIAFFEHNVPFSSVGPLNRVSRINHTWIPSPAWCMLIFVEPYTCPPQLSAEGGTLCRRCCRPTLEFLDSLIRRRVCKHTSSGHSTFWRHCSVRADRDNLPPNSLHVRSKHNVSFGTRNTATPDDELTVHMTSGSSMMLQAPPTTSLIRLFI
jgi:hypothetical protein